MDIIVGIAYSDSIDARLDVLRTIAYAESRLLQEPAPQVMVDSMADSAVNLHEFIANGVTASVHKQDGQLLAGDAVLNHYINGFSAAGFTHEVIKSYPAVSFSGKLNETIYQVFRRCENNPELAIVRST